MADTTLITPRSDLDIYEDVEGALAQYPPVVNDRHHVKVSVQEGVVKLVGHVKTAITTRYLQEKLNQISGVTAIDTTELYDDETMRLEIGQWIPFGIFANIEHGIVILSGRLTPGTEVSSLERQIRAIAGVRDVRTKFMPG